MDERTSPFWPLTELNRRTAPQSGAEQRRAVTVARFSEAAFTRRCRARCCAAVQRGFLSPVPEMPDWPKHLHGSASGVRARNQPPSHPPPHRPGHRKRDASATLIFLWYQPACRWARVTKWLSPAGVGDTSGDPPVGWAGSPVAVVAVVVAESQVAWREDRLDIRRPASKLECEAYAGQHAARGIAPRPSVLSTTLIRAPAAGWIGLDRPCPARPPVVGDTTPASCASPP